MNSDKYPGASALHHKLIEHLKREGHLRDAHVAAAFRAVPRHLFLPEVPLEDVYRDEAIATK
ncbi:MAG: methyltransferase, FxLD system, partial [Anaerolineales bacterium]